MNASLICKRKGQYCVSTVLIKYTTMYTVITVVVCEPSRALTYEQRGWWKRGVTGGLERLGKLKLISYVYN